MTSQACLLDGTHIEIQRAQLGDLDQLIAFTQSLSSASRHYRFFSVLSPETLAREMSQEMNDPRNVSLLAFATPGGRLLGHGLGALTVDDRAEVAFSVADDSQHHGIGTLLLRALLGELRERGVRHFDATTLFDNRPMLTVFRHAGFHLTMSSECVEACLDDPE